MMLADAEHLETETVGKLDLLEQLLQALSYARRGGAGGYIGEGGQA